MIRTSLAVSLFILAGCATASTSPVAAEPAQETAMKKHHGPHVISTKSENDFAVTLEKLQAAIDSRGFKTFAIIDHAKGAASVNQDLHPTTLIIFGNPQGGTPLLQSAQTLGIALPLKALVYENSDSEVTIATTDIAHALKEHGVSDRDALRDKVAGALQAIADEAATP